MNNDQMMLHVFLVYVGLTIAERQAPIFTKDTI